MIEVKKHVCSNCGYESGLAVVGEHPAQCPKCFRDTLVPTNATIEWYYRWAYVTDQNDEWEEDLANSIREAKERGERYRTHRRSIRVAGMSIPVMVLTIGRMSS